MRSGNPWFCQHLRVFDGHLVSKIVERRPRVAFDHIFLFAMKPPVRAIPYSLINGDGVDDQRISLPMAPLFTVERGIRFCGMWAPVCRDHAIVLICVDEFD